MERMRVTWSSKMCWGVKIQKMWQMLFMQKATMFALSYRYCSPLLHFPTVINIHDTFDLQFFHHFERQHHPAIHTTNSKQVYGTGVNSTSCDNINFISIISQHSVSSRHVLWRSSSIMYSPHRTVNVAGNEIKTSTWRNLCKRKEKRFFFLIQTAHLRWSTTVQT